MSVHEITIPSDNPENWKNLYVNSINTNTILVKTPTYFGAYGGTQQTCPPNVILTLTFQNEISPISGNIVYSYSTGIAQIQESGVYLVSYVLSYAQNLLDGERESFISKNNSNSGTDTRYGIVLTEVTNTTVNGSITYVSGSGVIHCVSQDTLSIKFYNNTPAQIVTNQNNSSSFSVVKVS